MLDLDGNFLTVAQAEAQISENQETIKTLTKQMTGMQEIRDRKYGGWCCDDGIIQLREDAKKSGLRNIDTQDKETILRDLKHQIKKYKEDIKKFEKVRDHVSKQLGDFKARNAGRLNADRLNF